MSTKAITLPGKDEMLRRLLAVNDASHLKKFYSSLVEEAGELKTGEGLVFMLTFAINGIMDGRRWYQDNPLFQEIPKYINALVDDPVVRQEARDNYEEVRRVGADR